MEPKGNSNSGGTAEPAPDTHGINESTRNPADNNRDAAGTHRTPVTNELEWRETLRGQHPGESYIRILRAQRRNFRRTAPGRLLATEKVLEPKGWLARFGTKLKRYLIGVPLSTAELAHERLTKINALAVFSSDAVSSSAYATEEILLVLILAGTGALSLTVPVGIFISILLAIVVNSYRQTILAYPQGGGTYIVAKDNLGVWPALVGASSLLFGYLLTVAVSVSAGVAAIASAFPSLLPHSVGLGVFFVFLITVINLRGVRESGAIFAAPTYTFIVSMLVLIAVGAYKVFFGGIEYSAEVTAAVPVVAEPVTLFLIVRAFVSGCVGLTGTEAVADGVPAFKPPEARNAVTTLIWMGIILATFLIGISFLASSYGVIPVESETAISQIARMTFGTSWFYFAFQVATTLILILAANTAFADFPRLSYFLARDNFLPHQFHFRGDRLAFSTGIIFLGILSAILIAAFQAETHALIPLYAVGVFLSFTISQTSMVKRWWTRRESGWHSGIVMNGIGAVTTGLVALIFTATKFIAGAWIVLVLIPLFVAILKAINSHYRNVTQQLSLTDRSMVQLVPAVESAVKDNLMIVPVEEIDESSAGVVRYAQSISSRVIAVHVAEDVDEANRSAYQWERLGTGVPLVVQESQKRSLVSQLLAFFDSLRASEHDKPVTIILAKLDLKDWWKYVLYWRIALRLRVALFFRPGTVVIDFSDRLRGADLKPTRVVIPIGDINEATVRTVKYARTISEKVTAVNVSEDEEESEELSSKWRQWAGDAPLIILESPYRSLVAPLLAYIDALGTSEPDVPITVVLAEFVPKHWWEFFLHNQSALRLRIELLSRPDVTVIHFPYHLSR